MPFNFYETHTLLMAVEQLTPANSFLRDRYFPTNVASDVFATDDVLVEYKDGSKKLAPFVAPRKGGVAVLRNGYHMERYTPPFVAPKRSLTHDDLKKRGFGESLYSKLTPAQRQHILILKDADELGDFITRREEIDNALDRSHPLNRFAVESVVQEEVNGEHRKRRHNSQYIHGTVAAFQFRNIHIVSPNLKK